MTDQTSAATGSSISNYFETVAEKSQSMPIPAQRDHRQSLPILMSTGSPNMTLIYAPTPPNSPMTANLLPPTPPHSPSGIYQSLMALRGVGDLKSQLWSLKLSHHYQQQQQQQEESAVLHDSSSSTSSSASADQEPFQ